MYYKLKNTLAGLFIATSILGVSAIAGQSPSAAPAPPAITTALLVTLADAPTTHKRTTGIHRQLSMPFFSFAPLLPRKGARS